jgi:hypothetical protein
MKKLQSGRSASISRRLRRPLTEITMPTKSIVVLEKPSPAQPTPTGQHRLAKLHNKVSRSKVAERRNKIKSAHAAEGLHIATSRLPQTKPRKSPALNGHNIKHVSAPYNVTTEFCAKAFKFMVANMTATLEYARRLRDVKSPSQFVELSASHARKQVDLAVTHSAALRAISLVANETSQTKKT